MSIPRMLAAAVAAFTLLVLFVPAVNAQDEDVLDNPSPQDIERILRQMKLIFNKQDIPGLKDSIYTVKLNGIPVQLQYSAKAGNIMLQTALPKISPDKVNAWNEGAVFTRAYLGKRGL